LSWTLGEEYTLRVFESRVLIGIFELKRNALTEGSRKLHNEEVHDLYSPPSKITVISQRV
jgi:hypothetical protein